jgi:hypothetical protein
MKYRWFEGIGSEIHPFKKYAWNESLRGISSRLRECRVGDEVLYLMSWLKALEIIAK